MVEPVLRPCGATRSLLAPRRHGALNRSFFFVSFCTAPPLSPQVVFSAEGPCVTVKAAGQPPPRAPSGDRSCLCLECPTVSPFLSPLAWLSTARWPTQVNVAYRKPLCNAFARRAAEHAGSTADVGLTALNSGLLVGQVPGSAARSRRAVVGRPTGRPLICTAMRERRVHKRHVNG